jgi:8-oxo-dGTP diphosphatase
MKAQIICHDGLGRKYSVAPNKLKFRPAVYGLLIEGNKVLLSKQWDGYDFPGGGVNLDETWEEAIVREFWEETGLRVKPLAPFFTCSSFYRPTPREGQPIYWNCPMVYFLVKKISGKLSIAHSDEHEKIYIGPPEWIDFSQLANCKFYNSLGAASIAVIKHGRKALKKNPTALKII